jgi:hypothetical protein
MQNERCEIFMNETKFEDYVLEENKFNPSLQIKGSTIPKNDEIKINFFGNYFIFKNKWKPHNKNFYASIFIFKEDHYSHKKMLQNEKSDVIEDFKKQFNESI